MLKPGPKLVKWFAALLVVALIVIFAFKAQHYISNQEKTERPLTPASSTEDRHANASISLEMLNALKWQNLEKLTRDVGTSSDKLRRIIELTEDAQNPTALYLRGFVLMITNKPLQALKTFDRLDVKDMPAPFLYPPYRLQRQMRPEAPNRYLGALNRAIDAGNVSPLMTARVLAQEGDPYSALSNYLQTDPAQWVTYDVECIKEIGLHSGLSSEIRRMIVGALKSGRVSAKVEGPLGQVLAQENDPAEVRAFKRKLKEELIQGSSTGKVAVSSIKQLLETRKLFFQRDYPAIVDRYQDANPMALPDESVLLLFLSGVRLEDRLEMDRWGQEIKRRYPNQEVIDWVSELTTSAR
ncbi:MAG: hypothetical protein JRF38_02145 [Deltaproteobacteria bacterium]|nr:hypothetical protein [Deltaproteobacteria bacterium]